MNNFIITFTTYTETIETLCQSNGSAGVTTSLQLLNSDCQNELENWGIKLPGDELQTYTHI